MSIAKTEWAFGNDAGEIFFAVVRPNNVRGAATECIEQTDKYVGLILPVLRLRPAVLDVEAHDSHLPPNTV